MTTIVYRDGVLAADTQIAEGDFLYPLLCHKVIRVERADGSVSLIAGCGSMVHSKALEEWIISDTREGPQPEDEKADDAVIVEFNRGLDGKVMLYSYGGDTGKFWSIEIPVDAYHAIGVGAPYAYGALAMGASAIQAVRAASKFSAGTNDTIEAYRFADNWRYPNEQA